MDTSVSVSVSDSVTDILNNNNKLIELFNEYLLYRKENKLSNSKTVINDLLSFLKDYNDKDKEKIIKEAIKKGWKEFYPPRKETNSNETEYSRI